MKKIRVANGGNPNVAVIAIPNNTAEINKGRSAIPTPAVKFDCQYMYNIDGDMIPMPESTTDVIAGMINANNLVTNSCINTAKINDTEVCPRRATMADYVRYDCQRSSYKIIAGQFAASIYNIQSCLYDYVAEVLGMKVAATEPMMDYVPSITSYPSDIVLSTPEMFTEWAISHVNTVGSRMYNDISMVIAKFATAAYKEDYNTFAKMIDNINYHFRIAMANMTYEASVFASNLDAYVSSAGEMNHEIDSMIDDQKTFY